MTANDDGYFDERIAATYDDDAAVFADSVVEPAVDFLGNLAGQGKILEFGIGTGRIALPLARRGFTVHGIDLSSAMVSRLLKKENANEVSVTIGDFSTTIIDDSFSVVYLVFNTIMNLTTQDAQVACFRNAAIHLQPGGHFVIEVMVPRLQRLPVGETLVAFDLNEKHWGVDEYDLVSQGLRSHHLRTIGDDIQKFSMPFRYVWPAELDLMAQLAGMTLNARWADWSQEPFTGASVSHISVWTKPAE